MFGHLKVTKMALILGGAAAAAFAAPVGTRAGEPAIAPVVAHPPAAPGATVETLYAALKGVMREGRQLGGEGRYRQLAPVIDRVFNLPLMTQVAVGGQWSNLNPDQQQQLVDGFRRFTIATYANHFDGDDGERFEITPTPQAIANGTLVQSRIVPRDKSPIELDYVMRESAGAWQIVDVYAEGTISELARRRSEFTALLRRSGPEALAQRLVEKAQTLIDAPA
jgi:phospholipid transport system substrate-binding protein